MEEIKRYTLPSIKIKNFKTVLEKKVVTIQKDDPIDELFVKFSEYNFHGFPVLDKDELVGVVTKSDLLNITTIDERRPEMMFASHVEDIMTPRPITVFLETDLSEAVDIMNKNRIRTLPIEDDEKLIGLLSYSDLVKTIVIV